MKNLLYSQKQLLEKVLITQPGFVLDFSDRTFDEFFNDYEVDIHSNKYTGYGTSKANKLRKFWDIEASSLVGNVLGGMLMLYENNSENIDKKLLGQCQNIVNDLLNKTTSDKCSDNDEFLNAEFDVSESTLKKLPVEDSVREIISNRIDEARKTLEAGAYLSTVILCGSVLEGALLGAANKYPFDFNTYKSSSKNEKNNPKPFYEWGLSTFIDVAHGLGILSLNVKKYTHDLRYFRNYVHPHEELKSGFTLNQDSARICFQVLKAGLNDLAKYKPSTLN